MPCPITITKFVGTISLGLLTGISYSLHSLTLPALTTLPTASHASLTLTYLRERSTRILLSLSTVSSLTLLSAYLVSPRRIKHPYLLWTSLVAVIGGPGVEWWFNGSSRPGKSGFGLGIDSMTRFVKRATGSKSSGKGKGKGKGKAATVEEEEEYRTDEDAVVVNGESVERDVERERRVAGVRMGLFGVGFGMGVVGIWGDGSK